MPKSTQFTVIWIDNDKKNLGQVPVLDYETFSDQSSLEARVISLSSQSIAYTVVTGDILEVAIDTSPRVTIGAAAPVEKKKRVRRTKAQIEADAIAAAAKKASGKVATAS